MEYSKDKGYDTYSDQKGNVYMTKGQVSEYFPCVSAHMDTVFAEHTELIEKNLSKTIKFASGQLFAYNPITNRRTGLGGDDLTGVFICLKMMEHFDNLKAAFFVEEEYGCLGSKNADDKFFENVGYVIQFDGPTGNWYTEYLDGERIFNDKFDEQVKPLLEKYKVDNYSDDPYTDGVMLMRKYNICCANLPTGYYKWHSMNEFVRVKDADKSILLGIDFLTLLGYKKYIKD